MPSAGRVPIGWAGTPATTVIGGMTPLATAPAAMTAPRPTVVPGRIMARMPIHTWSSITTGRLSRGNPPASRLCWVVRIATSGDTLTLSPMCSGPRASRQQSRLILVLAPMWKPLRRSWPGP